jgi:hypothetical protein
MGAFWDAWNKQGQVNDQAAMSQIQQASGLAGLMQQAQAQQQAQQVRGLLADPTIPEDQKVPALMRLGPAGIEVANKIAVMQEHQQKVAKAKRVEDFWANKAPQFNTPAQPARTYNDTPTGGMLGFQSGEQEDAGPQGLLSPAKPAGVDMEGLVAAAAAAGAVSPETVLNHRQQTLDRAAQREAMLETRRMQVEAQIEAARQRGADQRQIAEMQIQGRKDLATLAASLRPERQEPAPSVTKIADPNDPTKEIVVDARTGRKIGDALGKQSLEKALPSPAVKELGNAGTAYESTKRLANTFKDEYAGKTVTGNLSNTAGRILGDSTGQAQWWQDMDQQQNMTRHALFGSALTKTELAAWEKTSVSPRMNPKQVKENLDRRVEIEARAASKLARAYAVGGYNKEQIKELMGEAAGSLDTPAPPAGSGASGGWGIREIK